MIYCREGCHCKNAGSGSAIALIVTLFNLKLSDEGRSDDNLLLRTHLCKTINIFMLAIRGNNGEDRTRTLVMMGSLLWSRQEVSRKKDSVMFHPYVTNLPKKKVGYFQQIVYV